MQGIKHTKGNSIKLFSRLFGIAVDCNGKKMAETALQEARIVVQPATTAVFERKIATLPIDTIAFCSKPMSKETS